MNGFRSRYRRSVLALRRQLPPRERRDEIAAAERHADIVTSLAHLTSKQRAALVLIDFLELSSEEAGALMNHESRRGAHPGITRPHRAETDGR